MAESRLTQLAVLGNIPYYSDPATGAAAIEAARGET